MHCKRITIFALPISRHTYKKYKAVTPRKKALALGRAVLPLFVCYEIGVCNFMNRSGAFFIPRMNLWF